MPSWEEIWKTIVNFFTSNAWAILGFFVALVVGLILIKVLLWVMRRIMKARKVDPMAIRFIAAIVRFSLLVLLILILMSIVGIPISGLITAFSAAVLAVGMALKDFLSHLACGIILIASSKYHKGDYVIVGNVEGAVEDINFLFTTLHTFDNTQVTLPNSTMVNSAVTNLGSYEIRRVAITFSVAYESDTKVVCDTLVKVCLSSGLVLKDPAPACHLKTLGESSLDFWLTCYCDTPDYWDVFYYVMDHGFDELKKAGVSFPFKQVEVTQKVPPETMPVAYEELPQRVEKVRVQKQKKYTIDELEEMDLVQLAQAMNANKPPKKKKKPKGKKGATEEPAIEAEAKPEESEPETPAKPEEK